MHRENVLGLSPQMNKARSQKMGNDAHISHVVVFDDQTNFIEGRDVRKFDIFSDQRIDLLKYPQPKRFTTAKNFIEQFARSIEPRDQRVGLGLFRPFPNVVRGMKKL
jgi:hypothetical protein